MEIQQLRHFLAAAESQSFTRGAERAFVSQPAMSSSISKLEAEVGVKLFIRNKRNVVLTPAGRKLIKRAKLIVGECARAKDELKRHDVQRRLQLGVIDTLSISYVTRLIKQYRLENPDLKLNIIDANAKDMRKLEREGRIDLALTLLNTEPHASHTFIHSRALFSEPYVVAMARDHHLSKSNFVSIKDLNEELFIARIHCEHRQVFENLLKQHNVRLNMAYVTNQDERALALVEADVGVTIVPQHYTSSRITSLPLAEDPNKRTIGLKWGESENLTEITQFVDFTSTASWNYRDD